MKNLTILKSVANTLLIAGLASCGKSPVIAETGSTVSSITVSAPSNLPKTKEGASGAEYLTHMKLNISSTGTGCSKVRRHGD